MTGNSQGRTEPVHKWRQVGTPRMHQVVLNTRSSLLCYLHRCSSPASRMPRKRLASCARHASPLTAVQRPCRNFHRPLFTRQDVHTTPMPLPARASVFFDPKNFGGRVSRGRGADRYEPRRTSTNLDEPRRTSTNLDEPRRTSTNLDGPRIDRDATRRDAMRCDATADRSR